MARGGRVRVGVLGDFELDQFRIFELEQGRVGVVRTDHGIFAVRDYCPHMGARVCAGRLGTTTLPTDRPFEYTLGPEASVVRCPWHRWEFDLATGATIGHRTRKRLATYEVTVEGDDVFVGPRSRVTAGSAA